MASRELPPGLYDDLVTVALERLIGGLDATSRAQVADLSDGDAPARLPRHMADAIAMVLDAFDDEGRTAAGSALVHDLLAVLAQHAPEAVPDLHLPQPTRTLTVVEPRLPDGSYRTIERPLTSLHDTTLLVNAPGEPTIMHELA